MAEVIALTGRSVLENPATAFLGMHAAVALLAVEDTAGLDELARWCERHDGATHRQVVAPLARALGLLAAGRWSEGADRLATLDAQVWRLGGSDAQREVVEEARVAALLRAGRYDEARVVLDARLDRRPAARDEAWRAQTQCQAQRQAARILSP